MVAREIVIDLIRARFDFLEANDVGIRIPQERGKAFGEDGSQPVDVPRDDPHSGQAKEKSARTAWWSEASVGITA